MKTTLILTFMLFTQTSWAAPYYRFFRGVKLPQLTEQQYLKDMAGNFVPMAPKLFPHLRNYLVAIPAKGTGVDEVALLAYTSEEDYLRGRATAEGTAYTNAHWDVFEKEKSGSLVPGVLETQLEVNKAYDLLQTKPDWSKGYTTFFIGEKKAFISSDIFLKQLDQHVRKVRTSFKSAGLKGYVIIATADREYAFMNWESRQHADKAFAQKSGVAVRMEANQLMNVLSWNDVVKFKGQLVRNVSYTVK